MGIFILVRVKLSEYSFGPFKIKNLDYIHAILDSPLLEPMSLFYIFFHFIFHLTLAKTKLNLLN